MQPAYVLFEGLQNPQSINNAAHDVTKTAGAQLSSFATIYT